MHEAVKFKRTTCAVRVPLSPAQLCSMSEGIYGYLNSLITHHVKKLGGIVLGYSDDVRIAEPECLLDPRTPIMEVEVVADLYVLSLCVGGRGRGVLTRRGPGEGEGVLLSHGIVRVSVEGVPREAAVGSLHAFAARREGKGPLALHGEVVQEEAAGQS